MGRRERRGEREAGWKGVGLHRAWEGAVGEADTGPLRPPHSLPTVN